MYHLKPEPPPDEGSYDTNNSISTTLNKTPPDGLLQAEECGGGAVLPGGANLERLEDNKDHVQATEDGHGRDKVAKVQQARQACPGLLLSVLLRAPLMVLVRVLLACLSTHAP